MNIVGVLVLIGLCAIPILVLLWICGDLMDGINKNEDGYNRHNSSARVQCDAKEKCDYRHSCMCASCRHNRGARKEKTSYIPK